VAALDDTANPTNSEEYKKLQEEMAQERLERNYFQLERVELTNIG
jgi:hypothetical protein